MSTSILVPIDLAHKDTSAAVLKRAAQMADLDGAALSVITVVPDYGSSWVSTFFDEETMKKALAEAQTALHAYVDEVLPNHRPYRHIIGSGSVYEEILSAAEQIEADMIVIGAAKPNVTTHFLGPNAARVARYFNGSVLIVR